MKTCSYESYYKYVYNTSEDIYYFTIEYGCKGTEGMLQGCELNVTMLLTVGAVS
jgi:hypothetical protein